MRAALVLALVVLASVMLASVMSVEQPRDTLPLASQPLPKIAPAPGFTLTSQDGAQISLADLRGKVVAITFIFTLCTTTCPVLTPMMAFVQGQLGPAFGNKVVFASITVDPERDTPEMLKAYAQLYGADIAGWTFLTGSPPAIQDLTRRYGVFAAKDTDGGIEHSLLTSIVDRRGILRVQYLGARFDPKEFRGDLVSLMKER
jgi:protein SCO1/2